MSGLWVHAADHGDIEDLEFAFCCRVVRRRESVWKLGMPFKEVSANTGHLTNATLMWAPLVIVDGPQDYDVPPQCGPTFEFRLELYDYVPPAREAKWGKESFNGRIRHRLPQSF